MPQCTAYPEHARFADTSKPSVAYRGLWTEDTAAALWSGGRDPAGNASACRLKVYLRDSEATLQDKDVAEVKADGRASTQKRAKVGAGRRRCVLL